MGYWLSLSIYCSMIKFLIIVPKLYAGWREIWIQFLTDSLYKHFSRLHCCLDVFKGICHVLPLQVVLLTVLLVAVTGVLSVPQLRDPLASVVLFSLPVCAKTFQ